MIETLDKYLVAGGKSEDDPDPEPWHSFFPDMAVFWDFDLGLGCATARRTPPLLFFSQNPPLSPFSTGSIYQKDPKLFHPCCGGPGYVPPEKRSDAERAAAEAYETSRSMEEKESFSRALHDTMDVWCATASSLLAICISLHSRLYPLAGMRTR